MLDQRNISEKRWSDRRSIIADIRITFQNRTYYATTRDIGLGGLFINLEAVLIPGGADVQIDMLQYRNQATHTLLQTRVAYVTPRGYGLYYSEFKLEEFRHLQDILYQLPAPSVTGEPIEWNNT